MYSIAHKHSVVRHDSPPTAQNCPKALSDATVSPLRSWVMARVMAAASLVLEVTTGDERTEPSENCGRASFSGTMG